MRRVPCRRRRSARRSRGAVLVVGLIFLAMLTLMGVAAYSVATQEERMTANSRDRLRAFEAAEAALRECERLALLPGTTFTDTGVNGFFNRLPPTSPGGSYGDLGRTGVPWWQPAALPAGSIHTYASPIAGLALPPVCIAEAFDVDPGGVTSGGKPLKTVAMARISAHGWGSNAGTGVSLQSTVLR